MLNRTTTLFMVLAGIVAMLFMASCTEEDINRTVYQYNVRYQVISYMDTTSDMTITYYDPQYANHVSEYLEDIKSWNHSFKGETLDHCFLEAVVTNDSANLAVMLYVDSLLMDSDSVNCYTPIVCDTNRAVLNYTLE